MPDNKEIDTKIEPLLNEMLLTLAAFCQDNNKTSIEYAARISSGHINERIYKLTFKIDDSKGSQISNGMG